MSFLLDTNVVSEWARPRPDIGVVAWLGDVDEDRVFISVITLAELRHGIEQLASSARRKRLDTWLSEVVPLRFESRVLPVDAETANHWGRLMAQGKAGDHPVTTMDVFIAATAKQHDLTLVTRNVSDFDYLGIRVVNPWRSD